MNVAVWFEVCRFPHAHKWRIQDSLPSRKYFLFFKYLTENCNGHWLHMSQGMNQTLHIKILLDIVQKFVHFVSHFVKSFFYIDYIDLLNFTKGLTNHTSLELNFYLVLHGLLTSVNSKSTKLQATAITGFFFGLPPKDFYCPHLAAPYKISWTLHWSSLTVCNSLACTPIIIK